ncbi:hypothetical protein BGX27_001959, partial [Mortierella sp. AM989]
MESSSPGEKERVMGLEITGGDAWIAMMMSLIPIDSVLESRFQTALSDPSTSRPCETTSKVMVALLRNGLCLKTMQASNLESNFSDLICRVMNGRPEDEPRFRLPLGKDRGDIRPDGDALILYLAYAFKIRIFVFGSRTKPKVFGPTLSVSSIGIFKHEDALFSCREYLTIEASNPLANEITGPILQFPFNPAPPAASLREESRPNSNRSKFKIDEAAAKSALTEACRAVLETMIKSYIDEARKPDKVVKHGSQKESLQHSRSMSFENLKRCARVPQGVWSKALGLVQKSRPGSEGMQASDLQVVLRNNTKAIDVWREVLRLDFNRLWTAAEEKPVEQESSSSSSAPKKRKARARNRCERDSKKVKEGADDTSSSSRQETDTREAHESHGSSSTAQPSTSAVSGQGSSPSEDQKAGNSKVELRTCAVSVSLASILRPELAEHKKMIESLLNKSQMTVTAVIQELALLLEMTILTIVTGDVYGDSFGTISSNELDITTLLPSGFPIPQGVSPTMKLSTLPSMLQFTIDSNASKPRVEKTDLDMLLSQDFLQALYAYFIGPRDSDKNKQRHPLWTQIFESIKAHSNIHDHPITKEELAGLSSTIIDLISQYTTAVSNIFSGSSFDKSIEWTVRVLLRQHLAPIREHHKKTQVRTKAESKEKMVVQRKGRNRNHRCLRLFNELAKVITKDHTQAAKRVDEIKNRLFKIVHNGSANESVTDDVDMNVDIGSEMLEFGDLEGIDMSSDFGSESLEFGDLDDVDMNDDLGLETLELGDDFGGLEDFDVNSDFGSDTEDLITVEDNKEPSRRRLKILETIAKMLLLSPAIEGKVNRSWVHKSAYVGTELSDREADVIVQIVNGLRPYTPMQQPRTNGDKDEGHKSGTPHISPRAPMILVANKILRVCGYNDYTRRLCPHISSGAVYALPLPAIGIYEVLCAKKAGHFDVRDLQGDIIANNNHVSSAVNTKSLFEAFFDMTKVHDICKKNGLEFADRMTYVDAGTINILGSQLQHGLARPGYPIKD